VALPEPLVGAGVLSGATAASDPKFQSVMVLACEVAQAPQARRAMLMRAEMSKRVIILFPLDWGRIERFAR
jgi:hypothetical protein